MGPKYWLSSYIKLHLPFTYLSQHSLILHFCTWKKLVDHLRFPGGINNDETQGREVPFYPLPPSSPALLGPAFLSKSVQAC